MSHYLLSDVHLRPDQPGRAERLSQWADTLNAGDVVIVVGDLCDFWTVSRVPDRERMRCRGLQALADFRARGGLLRVMAGNHDHWLCPYYAQALGAEILVEPCDLVIEGFRLHLVHGHLLGARSQWKGWMETRQFLRAFGHAPGPVAGLLDEILEWKNKRGLKADEERHLAVFRQYADSLRGSCDLAVFGHVHRPFDDDQGGPRMIVLGGWQRRSSYVQIDNEAIRFHVSGPAVEDLPGPSPASRESPLPEPRCTSP